VKRVSRLVLRAGLAAVTVAAGSAFLSSKPARAQMFEERCRHFEKGDPAFPKGRSFGASYDALQACHTLTGRRLNRTTAYGPVLRSANRVCYSAAMEVDDFRSLPNQLASLERRKKPDYTLMLLADTCPRQSDPLYVPVYNDIDSATFAQLMSYWDRLQNDAGEFDRAFDRIAKQRRDYCQIGMFKKLMLDPKVRARLQVLAITAESGQVRTYRIGYGDRTSSSWIEVVLKFDLTAPYATDLSCLVV
jgi:hypothetical protein